MVNSPAARVQLSYELTKGGMNDQRNASADFERALNGRCFCPPGKHYPNCKAAKNINRIVCRLS